MRRLLAILVPVVAAGVVLTELAMDLDRSARVATYLIYAIASALTILGYLVVNRLAPRVARLSTAVQAAGLATVVVTAAAVVMAARSMFFSDHDRDVLLVVLGMGVGLAAALAVAIGRSVAGDLDRIAATAGRVASGDLAARTGIGRRDEVGAVARSFDAMVERMEATESERNLLIASVGHDLRTPLASLRAAIEAAQDGVGLDPAAALGGMAKDVEHLGRLVEDLFELARIESGTYRPRIEPVDLRELADETVEVCAPIAAARGVDLRLDATVAATAEVDPSGMGRVLRNLVHNAIRHCPSGRAVTVEVFDRGFRVTDQGAGFPEEFKPVAFDEFTRADPARGGDGAGLGLAIARGIVEAHGGSIEIEDGEGGRVLVRL